MMECGSCDLQKRCSLWTEILLEAAHPDRQSSWHKTAAAPQSVPASTLLTPCPPCLLCQGKPAQIRQGGYHIGRPCACQPPGGRSQARSGNMHKGNMLWACPRRHTLQSCMQQKVCRKIETQRNPALQAELSVPAPGAGGGCRSK